MATKPLTEQTTEELKKMRSVIVSILIIMGLLVAAFIGYMAYRTLTAGWDSNLTMGISSISMLTAIGAINGVNLSKISAEIRKREERV